MATKSYRILIVALITTMLIALSPVDADSKPQEINVSDNQWNCNCTQIAGNLSVISPALTPFTPSGPTSGTTGVSYRYSTSATDPCGFPIWYTFDWGDQSTSDTDLIDSGITVSRSHTWSSAGIYSVKAMAEDSNGLDSPWSKPLIVTISTSATSNPIPIYRMWSPCQTDHFYTSSYDEYSTTAVNCGYQQEGILGYIYDSPQPGTIPLYRMWSPSQMDHFYTTDYNEYSTTAVKSGYKQEGILGYIYSSNQLGSTPIYRMWSSYQTDHFYTSSYDEYSTTAVNYGYRQEGILGYVVQA